VFVDDPQRSQRAGRSSFSAQLMHDLIAYLRANPQVLVLLIICVVLGLGTFIVVLIALIASGSTKTTGEPSGVITLLGVMLGR
jgi:hypothetical protein